MKICMVGAGYVGLVSGSCFADLGNSVLCVDKDKQKIDMLNNGQIPIFEPGLKELIEKNYSTGRLKFTTNLNFAVIGRYVLPKIIFSVLKKQRPGQNGEIHITDAIKFLLSRKNKFIGHIFSGKYLDCGTMKGYINSTIEISKL